MIIIPQGTPEWHAARLGRVTASRVADVVAKTKTGPAASRANLMADLITEHLTGQSAPSYTSPAMQWGIDNEPDARAAYEFRTNADAGGAGLVMHPNIVLAAATPDGFVGDDGLIEIKCPNTATHIDTLLGQPIAAKYITQMQWQMACTGCKWVDFVSFDPRLPESMRLFIKRVSRNDTTIAELGGEVIAFLAEMNDKLAELAARYETKAAA